MKTCPSCGAVYADETAFCPRDQSPLVSGPGDALIGRVVDGRYRVERRLGAGGMGEVFLAHHVHMDRRAALKVMPPALANDAAAVARFQREATNAARVSHPNVCSIYDFGVSADGLVYLAMEFVDGRTVGALLREVTRLPVGRATAILQQAAAGLSAAHALGVVHRDLKPENIMLREQPAGDVVKLVDFGIARAAADDRRRDITATGFIVGTPEYMAPEQLAGDPVDARADQYGLALVYYRMLTGTSAFPADTGADTLALRLTTTPAPLTTVLPGVAWPPRLQQVLARALARRPQDRFASVAEFAAAAAEAVGTVEAPPTMVLPAPGPVRRGRRGVFLVLLAVLATTTWRLTHRAATPTMPGAAPAPTDTASGKDSSKTTPVPVALPGPERGAGRDTTRRAGGIHPLTPPNDDSLRMAGERLTLPTMDMLNDRARAAENVRMALAVWNAATAPVPQRALAAYQLGVLALDRQDPAGAREWFVHSCTLTPDGPCARVLATMPLQPPVRP